MLLINTYLEKSTIAGIGLFAAGYIPKGTLIWKENPSIDISFTSLDTLNLSPMVREQLDAFTYYDIDRDIYILCGDNARFWNHSDTPNCGEDSDNPSHQYTYTLRNILAGEELTVDYNVFHTGDMGF
jgi:hypothetical protein